MKSLLQSIKGETGAVIGLGLLAVLAIGSLWLGLAMALGLLAFIRYHRGKEAKDGKHLHSVSHRYWIRALQSWYYPWRLNRLMPAWAMSAHGLWLARSGGGKSELMRLRIFADLPDDRAVVLIAPHGDLAQSLARLKYFEENPDRLVYLSGEALPKGFMPGWNPLALPLGIPDKAHTRSVHIEELVAGFAPLFSDELTHHQRLLLKRSIELLIGRKDATIIDLARMITPGEDDGVIAQARKHSDPDVQEYFLHTFSSQKLVVTRHAVSARLSDVFSSHAVQAMLGAQTSSFDLSKAIKEKKIILLNLSQDIFGSAGSSLIGALFVAQLGTLAMSGGRFPARVYIDEAPLFVNSSSLEKLMPQTRKWGLNFHLATQQLDSFGTKLKAVILANTAVKVLGRASAKDIEAMGREMRANLRDLAATLPPGVFILQSGARRPVRYTAPDFLLPKINGRHNSKWYMDQAVWQTIMQEQIKRYYTSISQPAGHHQQTNTSPGQAPPLSTML